MGPQPALLLQQEAFRPEQVNAGQAVAAAAVGLLPMLHQPSTITEVLLACLSATLIGAVSALLRARLLAVLMVGPGSGTSTFSEHQTATPTQSAAKHDSVMVQPDWLQAENRTCATVILTGTGGEHAVLASKVRIEHAISQLTLSTSISVSKPHILGGLSCSNVLRGWTMLSPIHQQQIQLGCSRNQQKFTPFGTLVSCG